MNRFCCKFHGQSFISLGHLAKLSCSNRQPATFIPLQCRTDLYKFSFFHASFEPGICCHLISSLWRCHPFFVRVYSFGLVNRPITLRRKEALARCRISNRRTQPSSPHTTVCSVPRVLALAGLWSLSATLKARLTWSLVTGWDIICMLTIRSWLAPLWFTTCRTPSIAYSVVLSSSVTAAPPDVYNWICPRLS